ncbi:MAG: hypothetical protein ACI4U3_06690 [Traorella sp.]
MKIGYKQFNINPTFPVNRMLSDIKHQDTADELNCRVLILQKEGKPLYHLSIDTVEIYIDYRNQIKHLIEETLNCEIDLITSATHSHYCPCLTTDQNYRQFLLQKIKENITDIPIQEVSNLNYAYQYHFFDKTGKSRISGQDSECIFAETLSFYDNQKRLATVLIYNSHPTTQPMHAGDFTSEYPGYVISKLREKYPTEFFTFMLGPAGEISSRFTRRKTDYAEIAYLGNMLLEEYISQLENQQNIQPVEELTYQEIDMPIERVPVNIQDFTIPDDITGRERESILEAMNHPHEIDLEKLPKKHMFCHLILSKDYSMIFEPFETFSTYYRYVDKDKCSLITISNGFDHYLPNLGKQRITMELFGDTVSTETKKKIAELFTSWSKQSK